MEKSELVSLIEAEDDETQPNTTSPTKHQSPSHPFKFNPALMRWGLYRSKQDVVTLNHLKQKDIWKHISWFVLIIFFCLFVLGMCRIYFEFNFRSNFASYPLPYLCLYLFIYTVACVRGAIISKDPCVWGLLMMYYRAVGHRTNFFFEDDTHFAEECVGLEERDDKVKETKGLQKPETKSTTNQYEEERNVTG